jgi:hypothetical protein
VTDLAWMRPKLAELCGMKPHGAWYRIGDDASLDLHIDDWRPDEDTLQAIRCLERLNRTTEIEFRPSGKSQWYVLFTPEKDGDSAPWAQADTLPHAICRTIAAALGWEKPE